MSRTPAGFELDGAAVSWEVLKGLDKAGKAQDCFKSYTDLEPQYLPGLWLRQRVC